VRVVLALIFCTGFWLTRSSWLPRPASPESTSKVEIETFIQQDSKLAHVGDSNESDGDGGIDLLNEHLRLQLSTDRTPTPAGKPLHPLSFSFRSLVVAENFNEIRENSPTTAFV